MLLKHLTAARTIGIRLLEQQTLIINFTLDLGWEYNIVGIHLRNGVSRAYGVILLRYVDASNSWVPECHISALVTNDAAWHGYECPKMFRTRRIKILFKSTNHPHIYEIKFPNTDIRGTVL